MKIIAGAARVWCIAVLVAAVLVISACAVTPEATSEQPPPGTTEQQAGDSSEGEAQADVADWMTGTWMVDFALTSVVPDADWSRAAAGQTSAQWECQVDGSSMTIDAGLHVYTGTFSVAEGSGDEWLYDGAATWVDEDGVTWTSHIVVEGLRRGSDAFSASQGGEISSDTEGTLYTAEWDAVGTRVP